MIPGGKIFGASSKYVQFVPAFEPKKNEVVISKSLYSCYSSPQFARLMDNYKDRQVYVVGYNSIMCCLSTLVSAYHLGQKLYYVIDASWAKSTERFSEQENHRFAVDVIQAAGYAHCVTTADLLAMRTAS